MEIEHKLVCLPIDEKQMGELQALEKQGYTLLPGIPPVTVYHLIRQKAAAEQSTTKPNEPPSGPLKLTIDDSKIMVVKAGA
jgi:hypothetical protein